MEAPQGKRGAVRRYKQVGVLEIRGMGRNEMELDRPLAELRAAGNGLSGRRLLGPVDLPSLAARASALEMRRGLSARRFGAMNLLGRILTASL